MPWALLVASSVASLAVAEPSPIGRVIAAWPSFALIAPDELLMRQVRRAAEPGKSRQRSRGFEAGQKARNRLVGPVSGCLMPGEGRPAIGARFCFGEVAGCAGGHARGRRLRRGVRRPTGATAGSAMNGCRRACAEQVRGRLKKRLFLHGPAHRAQMLAETQGGRVLALGKVGAELYLAA